MGEIYSYSYKKIIYKRLSKKTQYQVDEKYECGCFVSGFCKHAVAFSFPIGSQ